MIILDDLSFIMAEVFKYPQSVLFDMLEKKRLSSIKS
jgi:hypothetical protein